MNVQHALNVQTVKIVSNTEHKGEIYETSAQALDLPVRGKGWNIEEWIRYDVVNGEGVEVGE